MRAILAIFILCAASFVFLGTTRAEDPIDTTRTMIEAQIKAFLNDDVDTAYSYAAPGIKAIYPDKETTQRLFVSTPYPQKVQRIVTRVWTRVKTGR